MRSKFSEKIRLEEAIENLGVMAAIRMDSPPPIGVVGRRRLVTSAEELEADEARWLSGEGVESILSVVDMSYLSILDYLESLCANEGTDWKSQKTKEGISSFMALAGESAYKMTLYLSYRLDRPLQEKVEERDSFRALQKLYLEKIASKLGISSNWESEMVEGRNSLLALQPEMKDFDALLADRDYELFYIADEKGVPYLDEKLLKNFKISVDFETPSGEFEKDPFLKVKTILDRDAQGGASYILKECRDEISEFFKHAKKLFHHDLARLLSRSVIALLLARNPHHLSQRTEGKPCGQYFHDFQLFLRQALKTDEYQKWISYPPSDLEKGASLLLSLAHKLSFCLVFRPLAVTQEAIGLIHRTMRKGEKEVSLERGDSLVNQLLFEDDKFRSFLEKYPNGPLLKILETVRKDQSEGILIPFDPWVQGNLPYQIATLQKGNKEIALLHLPSPTRQQMIQRAEILDEWRGCLRYMKGKKKHLLVNLQSRLSWKESMKSRSLEMLEEHPQFSSQLIVLTLPRNTSFYHQIDEYADRNHATVFIESLKQQMRNREGGGFFFSSKWDKESLQRFFDRACQRIYEYVFDSRETLDRQEREDFIEIFYQCLVFYACDHFKIDSLSFTCKDGVDEGACMSALSYAFFQILEGGLESKEVIDHLKFLLYWPALSVRERAVNVEPCHRMISAFERLVRAVHLHRKTFLEHILVPFQNDPSKPI